MIVAARFLLAWVLCPLASLIAQNQTGFDVDLRLDYSAAARTIELYEGGPVNTQAIAELRGNRIAASTTGLVTSRGSLTQTLQSYLDSLRYRQIIRDDVFQLETGRGNVAAMKELLGELGKRGFTRRVVATVGQIFPPGADISITIPVYLVAFGHENLDAYVRRIIWHHDTPQFVGDEAGELTIVVNLAQAIDYGENAEERFIGLLSVVAHEVFHAAFGAYKQTSPVWKRHYRNHSSPFDELADLTQNEGIAYYLSLDQAGRGYLPRDWSRRIHDAFETFSRNANELRSPGITPARAAELIRSANLSGYWDNYGAMTGMSMAREIDMKLGRSALIETIVKGPIDFFQKYVKISKIDGNLPKFPPDLEAVIISLKNR